MDQAIKTRTAVVQAIPENIDETRTFVFVASSGERDSHRTVPNTKNWNLERFNSNGVIGYQHQVYGGDICVKADPDDVIGKGRAYVEDGVLKCEITLEPEGENPIADKIFRKLKFGSLKAVSVGFVPFGQGRFGEGEEREGGSNQTYYFEGQELLEVSIVNIPSDAKSLLLSHRNWTANALRHVKSFLGDEIDLNEVRNMTIGQVMDRLSEDENHVFSKQSEVTEETVTEEVPTQRDYMRELQLLKLKSY